MVGRSASRVAAALCVTGSALLAMPASHADALAANPPTSLSTPSAVVKAWVPRSELDSEAKDPAAFNALKDWKLRVSQTRDLLNQTVEVSWSGTPQGLAGGFVQLMQCWSDGPTVEPTREQCAYGGIEENTDPTGGGRTRELGEDPREATYRVGGDIQVITVDGAVPTRTSTWPESSQLVFGGFSPQCPSSTTAYRVDVVAPRSTKLGRLAAIAPTTAPPARLTRQEGSQSRSYNNVTAAFSFADVRASAGISGWVDATYRVELSCLVPGEQRAPLAYEGFVRRTTKDGVASWATTFHTSTAAVPFDPVGDADDLQPTDPFERNQILDFVQPRTTNEITQAAARPDGTGDVFMELTTDLEAQHLACGRVESAGPRGCWLVAVPRWAGEPGGQPFIANPQASPLSQTLWD